MSPEELKKLYIEKRRAERAAYVKYQAAKSDRERRKLWPEVAKWQKEADDIKLQLDGPSGKDKVIGAISGDIKSPTPTPTPKKEVTPTPASKSILITKKPMPSPIPKKEAETNDGPVLMVKMVTPKTSGYDLPVLPKKRNPKIDRGAFARQAGEAKNPGTYDWGRDISKKK